MASKKPRILQDGRDMAWSLIPLLVLILFIAAIASQCEFKPGGPTAGPVPSFDIDAGLKYDAAELGFPIRHPEVPEDWQPNSGSRSIVSGGQGGDSSTVGFITPAGRYVRLTQSDAGEDELVRFVAGGARTATDTRAVEDHDWVVYGGEGVEALWVSDFGDVRILIGGSGDEAEFTTLATAAGRAEPLEP
ncbi:MULTISPECIES: DUF4245 domain-containing protein [Rhodococcus]|uniref:DUF4245 domain-containing protein n=1 Tax=Rhodococcus TaxID=1827 RepID=UPI000D057D11|nr:MULTISPECIES: DUF4245 domain-containing protein [Rhodococcus]AYA25521.1 DUF4245 domain-containing protein [Rhodococcus rhodochrous]MCD2096469.1 DUF4245 domain-containing protein [Rhodococcus rhodochrous]MCD2121313.1 DUF4245 domain-containing protein [Rhodococcus rhodochrous]MCQ4136874.1 DUF4245 domain-containing protein [Rhodococcus rhodochrous]MDC3727014.1 DUF4245 domain-containing protein [Rhodococcus sp. Rp3]